MKSNQHALIEVLQKNYSAEMESAATYRALAMREKDAHRADVIQRMAENEEQHAARWSGRLKEIGVQPASGPFRPRVDVMLSAYVSSIDTALRKLEAGEDAMVVEYNHQAATLGDPETASIIDELIKDEQRHAQSLKTMAGGDSHGPLSRLNAILRGEKHASTGSWIGDAIYGVNDGLGSVFGIVSGVSGATGGSHVVLLAGLAGMVASAVSMGSGAYLAAKSEGEVHQAELGREREEIKNNIAEEKEELALYYQLKGLSEDDARYLTERVAQDPERLLKVLAQEELGLSEDSAPNPWRAAITASISTAVGAFIPIIPFFFLEGMTAIVLAALISLVAHFVVGAAKSLITTRSWWASGLEMTVVGILAGTITYVVGVVAGPLAQ